MLFLLVGYFLIREFLRYDIGDIRLVYIATDPEKFGEMNIRKMGILRTVLLTMDMHNAHACNIVPAEECDGGRSDWKSYFRLEEHLPSETTPTIATQQPSIQSIS